MINFCNQYDQFFRLTFQAFPLHSDHLAIMLKNSLISFYSKKQKIYFLFQNLSSLHQCTASLYFNNMDYVLKKTYVGLALEQVIEQNGLEHMSKDLGELFKAAFMKNYNQLAKHAEPLKIVGTEENLKESPIGSGDQYSCFTVLARQINYRGQIEFLNQKPEATTCIEAFSDNKKKISKPGKPLHRRAALKNHIAARLEKKNRKNKDHDDDDAYGSV